MTPGPGRGERRRGRRREAAPRSAGGRGNASRRSAGRGGGARGGTLSRREPTSARDAVADSLEERLGLRGFSGLVEEEAARAAEETEARDLPRRDLTELATFTVDPATARDFDDAVSAQREGKGWRVWVHIADVAAHVRPG